MSNEIHVLLENISLESVDSTYSYGGKYPGAGYHKKSNPIHTVVYQVTDFVGTIKIQATLALDPAASDWFDVDNTTIGLGEDSSAWTSASTFNFSGNFVWIRAAYNIQNGTITSVSYLV